MATKKKTKKTKVKAKPKAKKAKKTVKKTGKKSKKAPKKPGLRFQPKGEKFVGKVEHYFDKILVAAIPVKTPFKVGDTLHFIGSTCDFYQTITSMQIEHLPVQKVKKGDDVGIKVVQPVKEHVEVYRK
jgi:hypothetical protein